MQPGTLIPQSDEHTVGSLLTALSDCQRQRFGDRLDRLYYHGVEPGDAWQVAASHQRQSDLPNYVPTAVEQEAMDRTAGQLSGERPAPEPLSQVSTLDRSPLTQKSDTDSDANHQQAIAQAVLDNARQVMNRVIDPNSDPTDPILAENTTYRVTRKPNGELRVENRQTGGITVGDETGVQMADGLTVADQQLWELMRQSSDPERLHELDSPSNVPLQGFEAPHRNSDLEL